MLFCLFMYWRKPRVIGKARGLGLLSNLSIFVRYSYNTTTPLFLSVGCAAARFVSFGAWLSLDQKAAGGRLFLAAALCFAPSVCADDTAVRRRRQRAAG